MQQLRTSISDKWTWKYIARYVPIKTRLEYIMLHVAMLQCLQNDCFMLSPLYHYAYSKFTIMQSESCTYQIARNRGRDACRRQIEYLSKCPPPHFSRQTFQLESPANLGISNQPRVKKKPGDYLKKFFGTVTFVKVHAKHAETQLTCILQADEIPIPNCHALVTR